jgi:hypothetical protein
VHHAVDCGSCHEVQERVAGVLSTGTQDLNVTTPFWVTGGRLSERTLYDDGAVRIREFWYAGIANPNLGVSVYASEGSVEGGLYEEVAWSRGGGGAAYYGQVGEFWDTRNPQAGVSLATPGIAASIYCVWPLPSSDEIDGARPHTFYPLP